MASILSCRHGPGSKNSCGCDSILIDYIEGNRWVCYGQDDQDDEGDELWESLE